MRSRFHAKPSNPPARLRPDSPILRGKRIETQTRNFHPSFLFPWVGELPVKRLDLIVEEGEQLPDVTCFNKRRPPRIRARASNRCDERKATPVEGVKIRRAERNRREAEANMEARICQGNRKNGGRLSSSIAAKCVFCHIRFDARPLHDRSPPSSLAAAVARASDVVHESQPSSHTECYK